jgi:hypothetical protein
MANHWLYCSSPRRLRRPGEPCHRKLPRRAGKEWGRGGGGGEGQGAEDGVVSAGAGQDAEGGADELVLAEAAGAKEAGGGGEDGMLGGGADEEAGRVDVLAAVLRTVAAMVGLLQG